MPTTYGWTLRTPSEPFTTSISADDVIEMPLLLPEWQVMALEEAARDRGMTIGQLVRRLFADLFPRPMAMN
jgi:hypothetical protein